MNSDHQPLLSKKQSSSSDTTAMFYEKMMQEVSETFNNFRILVTKMPKMILEAFKKFDNWKKCAFIFYSLAWISWSVASLSISSLIMSFLLIFLVFPALLSGLYILQSVMFFFIIQSPETLFVGNAGFGLVHEILYPEFEGSSLLMFAFAFQQTGLILQYRYYSGFSKGTFPVDFWEQGKIMLKIFVAHLIQTLGRSYFHGYYVEAGALLVPTLVGFFAICYRGDLSLPLVKWQSLVNKIRIQSPEGKVSAELDSPGHKADKLKEEKVVMLEKEEEKEVVEEEEGEVLREEEEEEEEEEKVVEKEEGQVLQEEAEEEAEEEEEEEVEEGKVVGKEEGQVLQEGEEEEVEEEKVVEKEEGQVLQGEEEVEEENGVEKEKVKEEEEKVVEKEEGEVLQEEEKKVVEKEEVKVLQEEEEEELEEEKVVEKEKGEVLQEEEEEEEEEVEKEEGKVVEEDYLLV